MKQIRKLMCILLVLCLMLVMMPLTVLAASEIASGTYGADGDNLTWVLTDDGVLTISGTGDMVDFGYGGAPWYECSSQIQSVVIEEGATSIGAWAFLNCTNLSSVTIPGSVDSIGIAAFYGCSSLESVTIPEGVTIIDGAAFQSCTSLESITIPSSVTSIASGALGACSSLNGIWVSEDNQNYSSDAKGILFDKQKTNLILVPQAIHGTCTIPDGVTVIGSTAFANCSGLTGITLPDTLTSIDEYAFAECSGLSSLTIPAGVTSIGKSAFPGCSSLKSLTIPAGVTTIGDSMFSDCTGLEEITFTGDAPSFGIGVFYDVTAMAYYPRNNATWTSDVMQNYDGTITWRVVCTDPQGHSDNSVVTAPTCTEQGYTTHTCSRCNDSYVDTYVDALGHDWVDSVCRNCGEGMAVPTTPMYRLYNPNSGEHFYTGSVEERDALKAAGWNYEGVAWNAPTTSGAPVYRLFNPNSGDHHYTMSAEERDNLVNVGWKYEGVAWNSAPENHPDSTPLFRLYNPNADCGSHHYTGSIEEKDMLVSVGWIYEGIGWFGLLK